MCFYLCVCVCVCVCYLSAHVLRRVVMPLVKNV